MRTGCVVDNLEQARIASELGYDYLEVKGEMLLSPDQDFCVLADNLRLLRAPVEALTSPIPRHLGLKVVGPEANHAFALAVFEKTATRAAALGAEVITFGCSNARSFESNVLREDANRQLGVFVQSCAAVCRDSNLVMGVECLNRSETNILNSPQEARRFIEQMETPNIGITLDSYHILSEGIELHDGIECVRGLVVHAHTADKDRKSPTENSESVARFVKGLVSTGYTGRISVESKWSDFRSDLGRALVAVSGLISECKALE